MRVNGAPVVVASVRSARKASASSRHVSTPNSSMWRCCSCASVGAAAGATSPSSALVEWSVTEGARCSTPARVPFTLLRLDARCSAAA